MHVYFEGHPASFCGWPSAGRCWRRTLIGIPRSRRGHPPSLKLRRKVQSAATVTYSGPLTGAVLPLRGRRRAQEWKDGWIGGWASTAASTIPATAFVGLLSIGNEERCTGHWRDRHFSRARDDYLVGNFRKILIIASGTKVDPYRGENIGGPAVAFASESDGNHAAIGSALLRKIRDLKKMITRDTDLQSRTRDNLALERIGNRKTRPSEQNKHNQKSDPNSFHGSTDTRIFASANSHRFFSRATSFDCERSVKGCEADPFRARDVRTMLRSFGSEEQSASSVNRTRFLPFARQHVSPFVGVRMRVRWNGITGIEFAQYDDSAGALMFV